MGEIEAIRCDRDGLKMAEVQDGHLVLRRKHHGETHVKIVPLAALGLAPEHERPAEQDGRPGALQISA